MNARPNIEFRKTREIGEIVTDTFTFIRNEFRPLVGTLLRVVGPWLLLMLASTIAYMYFVGDIFTFASSGSTFDEFSGGIILATVLSLYLFSIVTYVLSQGVVLCYIRSYIANGGQVDRQVVRRETYALFWPLVGLGILVSLIVVAGILLCFFPGVYVAVALSPVAAVMVYERRDVTEAISDSFKLIKGHWWTTFATLIVLYLIAFVASLVLLLPTTLYSLIQISTSAGAVDAEGFGSGLFQDPIYLGLNILQQFVSYMVNLLYWVALVFVYFNLNERHHSTGSYEKIKSLGETGR